MMRAMIEGKQLVDQKRAEADKVAISEVGEKKKNMMEDARRRLKEVEEEAEALAKSQADLILSSTRSLIKE